MAKRVKIEYRGELRTPEEVAELLDEATRRFTGDTRKLIDALGLYMLGRNMGWRPLYLMYSPNNIRRAEKILEIKFREEFPEVGEYANKSVAWHAVQKVKSFWAAVRGDHKGVRTGELRGEEALKA